MPRSKEDSQQCQASSHHNKKQKDDQRVLLAHAVIGLIKPVPGLLLFLSLLPTDHILCPVKKIAASPHCFLPHEDC
ncbi:hypothetical protein FKM82_006592 [Ascaphus truei]